MNNFERTVSLPLSPSKLFEWHEREGAFQRLCPPWDPVDIKFTDGHIRDGAQVKLKVKGPLGVPLSLEVVHQGYEAGVQFQDRQQRGPFAHWLHTHTMGVEDDPQRARLIDSIEYKLPLGFLGELGGGSIVRHRLAQLFYYRHQVMRHDLSLHQRLGNQKLHFAISGSSGLLGRELCALLTTGGHRVTRLTRSPAEGARVWRVPEKVPQLDDVDVVIHLAGEPVAERWTPDKRRRILESRVLRTRALAQALADARARGVTRTQTLISASGIGYYGYRGHDHKSFDESTPLGEGFLAEVCDQWEAACEPATDAGIRVVKARIGIVLSPLGGALGKLLLPFSLGVGGRMGSGHQWMSWISIHDVVGALYECALQPQLEGPVNLTSPHPVKNNEFVKTLGKVLGRPTLFPAPALALKIAFGDMANETILASQNAVPRKLMSVGYPFMHQTLEEAIRFELGRVPEELIFP